MKKHLWWLGLLGTLLLSACAMDPSVRSGNVVVDDLSPGADKGKGVPEALSKGLDKTYVAMLNKQKYYVEPNSAVASLLATAERQKNQGELDAAASTLERALRISSRNALLWHQFATVRYQQGDYPQAMQLARKSNSYAQNDKTIQTNNWRIIGHIKQLQGDIAGAKSAFAKASGLLDGN